jgi:lysophospholipase L1-like esterase
MSRLTKCAVALVLWGTSGLVLADELVVGAIGDSITRAFNAGAPLDQPEKSWATGDNDAAESYSHAGRLRGLGYDVRAHNAARSGANAVELAGQVDELFDAESGRAPDYVTLMIGANDVCDWGEDHGDALAAFYGDVDEAVGKLVDANPAVKILMAPIPNMLQLWSVGRANGCQARWDLYRMCTPLLGRGKSAAERARFGERLADANAALADVASQYPDHVLMADEVSSAVFEWRHISGIDCFHPSEAGQELLGDVTWDAGWFAE